MEEERMTRGERIAWGILVIITIGFFVTVGCGCSRKVTQPTLPVVSIESKISERVVHTERIDTMWLSLPAQSAERTMPDTCSHLETDHAESDVWLNSDGTLRHRLRTKPHPVPVPVKNSSDTIYVDKVIEKPVPVEVPVEVERELTWWQRTRLVTWGWLAGALALCICWTQRKPILTLARRLISKE